MSKFVDADYNEIPEGQDTDINENLLFFTTSQVADIVGEEVSCIRYWSKRFEHLLDIEISNKNRQYKKSDIMKLKFIKKLIRKDGLTLQQVDDYINVKGFKITDIESSIIEGNNPLAVQMFISAMTVEFDKKLNELTEKLENKIDSKIDESNTIQKENNEKLQENIVRTVDELVSTYLSQKEERDIELINELKRSMEYNKLKNMEEEKEKENKKGFWDRIWGR